MIIHGSELVAVAQGLVEYWDSGWTFSALRQNLKNVSEHDSRREIAVRSPVGEKRKGGADFRSMTKWSLDCLPISRQPAVPRI